MGVSVHWDNSDQTIIRWDFAGRWTSEEFSQALADAFYLARTVHHTVYGLGIIDGNPPGTPVNMNTRLVEQWPTNLGNIFFVGAHGALKNAFSTLSRVFPHLPKAVFTDTPEAAYERISQLHLIEEYARSS